MKTTKKARRPTSENPERLTTQELLAMHERVFGPLSAEAKERMAHAAEARSWGMDGLAA